MSDEIIQIFQKNKHSDLQRFLSNRRCLNTTNICFTYLFYFIQMVGLLTTSVAQSYNMTNVVWVGIGLNSLATLIHTFQQTNNKISKHMLDNIISIKNGTYVDEGILIDIDDKSDKKSENMSTNNVSTNNVGTNNVSTNNVGYSNTGLSTTSTI
jgi:hypothetical protein